MKKNVLHSLPVKTGSESQQILDGYPKSVLVKGLISGKTLDKSKADAGSCILTCRLK